MNAPRVTPERQALNAAKDHLRAGFKAPRKAREGHQVAALNILVIYAQSLGAK